jgi:hypothetical protein
MKRMYKSSPYWCNCLCKQANIIDNLVDNVNGYYVGR